MTPEQLDKLAGLAEKATPGPWTVSGEDGQPEVVQAGETTAIDAPICFGHGYDDYGSMSAADAAYIAALSPAVVSELVEAARLGAAWRTAEEALPEGWVTGLIGIAFGIGRWYTASAYVDLTDYADDHDAESAQADSPTAALFSLAEALRGRSG